LRLAQHFNNLFFGLDKPMRVNLMAMSYFCQEDFEIYGEIFTYFTLIFSQTRRESSFDAVNYSAKRSNKYGRGNLFIKNKKFG